MLLPNKVEVADADALELVMAGEESGAVDDTLCDVSILEDTLLKVTISREVEALEVPMDESEGLDDALLDITVSDETAATEVVDVTVSVVVIDTPIEEAVPEDATVLRVMLLDTSIAESFVYKVKRFAPPQSSPAAPEQSMPQSASGAAFPDSAAPQ